VPQHTFSSYGLMPTAFSCSLLMSVPSCSSELGFASTCTRKIGREAETQRMHGNTGPFHNSIAHRTVSSSSSIAGGKCRPRAWQKVLDGQF